MPRTFAQRILYQCDLAGGGGCTRRVSKAPPRQGENAPRISVFKRNCFEVLRCRDSSSASLKRAGAHPTLRCRETFRRTVCISLHRARKGCRTIETRRWKWKIVPRGATSILNISMASAGHCVSPQGGPPRRAMSMALIAPLRHARGADRYSKFWPGKSAGLVAANVRRHFPFEKCVLPRTAAHPKG